MGVKFSNNGHSTLAASITSSDTSITVASGHGARFPSLGAGDYFYATLIDASNNLEIVKCTARSSDVLTVTRGQESTTARAYAIADRIELRVTAQGITDATTIANDSITNAMMADDAIDTAQIADDAITAALIADNVVGAAALNVSGNGTSGQALLSDGDGTFSWGTAGGIVQVKTARQTSVDSTGSDNVMVGPTATITPTSSSNKILVMVQATVSGNQHITGSMGLRYATGTSVSNSATIVGGGAAAGSRSRAIAWAGLSYADWNGMNIGYHILHDPATTSQISYRLCVLSHDGVTWYLGRTGRDSDNADHPRVDTNITLMEIASGVL